VAVNNLNFSAQVDAWCRESEARMVAVWKESTQRVVHIAQAGIPHIPVDTGFARASVRASLESMPPIDPEFSAPPHKLHTHGTILFPYDEGQIVLVINGAQLGQTIYIGWTANYVGELESGSSNQAPSGFVRLAAEQWQVIVNGVVEEAKSRAAA
jgi:hypothetical protein